MPTPPQSDREKLRKEWFEQTPYRCNCRTYGEETCAYHKCIADWWLDKMFPEKCQGHPRSRYCTGSHPCTCSTPNKSSLTAFDTAEKELAKEIDEKTESSLRDAGFPEGSQAAGNLVILPTPAKSPSPSGEECKLRAVGGRHTCGPYCAHDHPCNCNDTPTSPVVDFQTTFCQEYGYKDDDGKIKSITTHRGTCKDCKLKDTSSVEEGCWEIEFDEKFPILDEPMSDDPYQGEDMRPQVKSFIRSAISTARKERDMEVVKMIEGMKKNFWKECGEDFDHSQNTCKQCDEMTGWNSALTALTDKLK